MNPPKKTGSAKSTAKGQSAPKSGKSAPKSGSAKAGDKGAAKGAGGKGGGASGAVKNAGAQSTAKSTAKSQGTGKAPAKKRKPRKKKGGTQFKIIFLAFVAGLVIASAAVWFLRDVSLPGLLGQQSRVARQEVPASGPDKAKASAAKPAQTKPAPDKAANAAAQKARSGGEKAKDARGAVAASPAAPPAAAAPQSSSAPSGPQSSRREAASSAVASALIDLQSLPYEEAMDASLDDRIRQVDYALMQAAWTRKLPARALRLVSVEDRLEGVEPYQFQVIDILPGKSAAAFAGALRECLDAWSGEARLVEAGGNVLAISVNGVHTHSVRLYPGKKDFPPLPGHEGQGAAGGGRAPDELAHKGPLAPQEGRDAPFLRGPDEAPRLVIVIDDLGTNHKALQQLLALDFPVTCAFWPHGKHTREGARAAQAKGMEILIHQPMEPLGYPKVQPGPGVLLTGMDEVQIRRTLDAAIRAVPHAVGLNNHMGSRFTQSRQGTGAVVRLLKERGLFMLDSVTHSRSVFAAEARRLGLENYKRHVFLDVAHSRAAVLEALRRAEHIALMTGRAVAIGHPLPETLAGLKEWQRSRNRQIKVVRLRDLQ